ncbi:MAG: hypothetical protein K6G91_10565 [Kiritimatiellae bacterium]|nr:hypothetical protein [Kiritimatiellia bacterium]
MTGYCSEPIAVAVHRRAANALREGVLVGETRPVITAICQASLGDKSAFGGIALEFCRDVAKWYSDPAHWKHQGV